MQIACHNYEKKLKKVIGGNTLIYRAIYNLRICALYVNFCFERKKLPLRGKVCCLKLTGGFSVREKAENFFNGRVFSVIAGRATSGDALP